MSEPLDPEVWRRVDRIVAAALELEPEARAAFVERECAGDETLRAEVASLLVQDARTKGFLDPSDSPAFAAFDEDEDEDDDAWIGHEIGGFRVESRLGAGGMGRVYLARQASPARRAAVKVMRQHLRRPRDVRRFEHEAETLARMQHPCIAHVYASGLVEDPHDPGRELPYFAMELVPGGRSITDYAREEGLDPRARIELFLEVCDGVHHAHLRGVLHRDLKPSNVIVDAEGRPRVIDFGIARVVGVEGDATRTRDGRVVGTLQYMSPQQCAGSREEIDARSDVYSLGLVLYELLTDVRAYELSDTTFYEALRIIRDVEPAAPSRHAPACRGDLDVIVLKALRKEPDDRYASVHELAQDLARFLRREPILARPPSAGHRLRLFAARNPLGAAASVLALVALAGGATVATIFGLSEARASREARRRAAIAEEVNTFLNEDLLGAIDPYTTADPDVRVRDVLERAAERIEGRFPEEPRVEAELRRSIASAYASIGLPLRALPHAERALALLEAELGTESPELFGARFDLAAIQLDAGHRGPAEGLLLALLDELPEEERVLRAQSLGTLGQLRLGAGELEEGVGLAEEAHAIFVEVLGADDVETLIMANNIAQAQASQGRLDEAEALFEEVVDESRTALGEENLRTATSLGNLGVVHLNRGDHEQARELLEQALAIHLRTGGEDHAGTLVARRNLALVYLNLGRLAESEEEILLALAGYERAVDAEHRESVAARLVLGQLRLKQGRTEEAEEILWETYERGSEHLGATHAVTREAALHLSRTMGQRGARDEAIELLATVVEDGRLEGLSDETTLALVNYQATLLLDAGRPSEAEPLLAEVTDAMRATMGVHPGTAVSLRNYGRCLVALERYGEAEEALLEAHDTAVELFGEGHTLSKEIGALLVRTYEGLGLQDEARAWRARS